MSLDFLFNFAGRVLSWVYPEEMIESDMRAARRGTMPGFLQVGLLAAAAIAKAVQQHKANKQIKDQAATSEEHRKAMLAKNKAFLDQYGSQIANARSTSSSATTGGGSRSTKQRKVVDAAQADMKAKLEQILGTRQGQTDFVTPEEKAARNIEIAATERATQDKLSATAGARNISTGSNPSMYLPALQAASQARIAGQAQDAAQNRQEAAAARAESAGFMQDWAGQDTNENYTSFSNTDTTDFDPARNLSMLYGMNMYDPGAEQKPMTVNPWLQGAGDLAGAAAQYYANKEQGDSGGGGGGAAPAAPWTPNNGANFQTPPIDQGWFAKKPPTPLGGRW